MDRSDDGQVWFSDFVVCCSHMLSGDVKEKLDFSFTLYANDDGQVTKDNMLKVLNGINSSASWFGDATLSQEEVASLVDDVFTSHDASLTGTVSDKLITTTATDVLVTITYLTA